MNEVKLGNLASLDDSMLPPATLLSGNTEQMKLEKTLWGGVDLFWFTTFLTPNVWVFPYQQPLSQISRRQLGVLQFNFKTTIQRKRQIPHKGLSPITLPSLQIPVESPRLPLVLLTNQL